MRVSRLQRREYSSCKRWRYIKKLIKPVFIARNIKAERIWGQVGKEYKIRKRARKDQKVRGINWANIEIYSSLWDWEGRSDVGLWYLPEEEWSHIDLEWNERIHPQEAFWSTRWSNFKYWERKRPSDAVDSKEIGSLQFVLARQRYSSEWNRVIPAS